MEMRSESEIERSVEKLLQDLRDIVHEGEELLKAGMEDTSEHGSAAREKLFSVATLRNTRSECSSINPHYTIYESY